MGYKRGSDNDKAGEAGADPALARHLEHRRCQVDPRGVCRKLRRPYAEGLGAVPSRDGHDGIRRAIERLRVGFPDWREHIDDMVIDEDRVAVRYHSTGTHLGAFAGMPASGRRVEVDELSIFRIKDGRVAEQWCLNDDLAFGKQIRGEPLG
jgi:steroid delta-isomerase-like uncharacterized protein